MSYVIEGLDPRQFASLFEQDDRALAARNIVVAYASDDDYPCRVSLHGAAKGDRLLLINYRHQPADTPYSSAHAIYVASGSQEKAVFRDRVPPVMQSRLLSIRAFDSGDMMRDADVVEGRQADSMIRAMLASPDTAYLHIHFAKRGCFAAQVRRR
jgi:Protein of unknown function (DUF1203)